MSHALWSPSPDDAPLFTPIHTAGGGRPARTGHAGALWRALKRAGDDVCASVAGRADDTASPDVRRIVDDILAAVAGALCGTAPSTTPVDGRDAKRVVRRLRQQFVLRARGAGTFVDGAELVRALSALDAIEDAMEPTAPSATPAPGGLVMSDHITQLAHDVRSPLTSILFLSDSLRSGQAGVLNAVQKRQLGLIYGAAFGLCSVANDLLEVARADGTAGSGLGSARPVAFSVTEILHCVRDIVLPIAEEKGATLRLATPEVDGRVGYPSALIRVLLNLVTNALRVTQEGTVEIDVRESGGSVEYRVTDSGPGIAPELLPQLFHPMRLDPAKPREAFCSAGLGLSICRWLVQAMGGELRVESRPGEGTCFSFTVVQPPARFG